MAYQKLSPKKSLGQNFLKDENIARKIVSSLLLQLNDNVLEIGPGTGMLTKYIIPDAGRFIAIEIDNKLAPKLRELYREHANFELIHDDILRVKFEEILSDQTGWKVVANLPYHITDLGDTQCANKLITYR